MRSHPTTRYMTSLGVPSCALRGHFCSILSYYDWFYSIQLSIDELYKILWFYEQKRLIYRERWVSLLPIFPALFSLQFFKGIVGFIRHKKLFLKNISFILTGWFCKWIVFNRKFILLLKYFVLFILGTAGRRYFLSPKIGSNEHSTASCREMFAYAPFPQIAEDFFVFENFWWLIWSCGLY